MSLTTQLRQLGRINLGSLPGITLQLLRVQLPLRKETNLPKLASILHPNPKSAPTYQVSRVLHVTMSPEFRLDILIPQQPHIMRQMLAMRAEQATIQVHGRQ